MVAYYIGFVRVYKYVYYIIIYVCVCRPLLRITFAEHAQKYPYKHLQTIYAAQYRTFAQISQNNMLQYCWSCYELGTQLSQGLETEHEWSSQFSTRTFGSTTIYLSIGIIAIQLRAFGQIISNHIKSWYIGPPCPVPMGVPMGSPAPAE